MFFFWCCAIIGSSGTGVRVSMESSTALADGAMESGAVPATGDIPPWQLAKAIEATRFQVENIRMAYVFYGSGLSINVMHTVDDPKKRAVGFKLSDGMEVPAELASRFKFARQKSKLAGTIRGSFFVIKGEY